MALNGSKNRSRLRIDLVDLAAAVLAHPERPFGPREPRITASARRRDRGEHMAGIRIDLLDAPVGDLKQMATVEGRSRVRDGIDRAHRLPAIGIEGLQPVSGGKPDVPTVKCEPMNVVSIREGSVLAQDFSR
jgi:hypothetical protein